MINKIKQVRNSLQYNKERVYLLEKESNLNGFFLFDNKLAFAQKVDRESIVNLSTTLLDFHSSIYIKSIENDPSFEEGLFDFLILKTEEQSFVLDFVVLCKAYMADQTTPFEDFIKGMIDLFQLPKRESKLNTIGLIGELSIIKKANESFGKNFTFGWHLSGAFSKYDFCFEKFNLEIKTTTNDSTTYQIKHSQLFNDNRNYIGLVKIEHNDIGLSLKELINEMQHVEPYCSNVRFQIALKKELNKSFDIDELNVKYSVLDYYFFENQKLETISKIPLCISDVEYKYDFDVGDSLSFDEFIESIK